MSVQYSPEVAALVRGIAELTEPKPADVLAILKTLRDCINDRADVSAEATMWENDTVEAIDAASDTIEFPNEQRRERLKKAQGDDWASYNLWA